MGMPWKVNRKRVKKERYSTSRCPAKKNREGRTPQRSEDNQIRKASQKHTNYRRSARKCRSHSPETSNYFQNSERPRTSRYINFQCRWKTEPSIISCTGPRTLTPKFHSSSSSSGSVLEDIRDGYGKEEWERNRGLGGRQRRGGQVATRGRIGTSTKNNRPRGRVRTSFQE